MSEDKIEQLLKRHFARNAADDGARVMTKLQGPLPQQKRPTFWPQLLLNWQYTPAWPRMAALAGCAALGFNVGSATVDRFVAPAAGGNFASIAFEPEPLTGLRP
jgi:hypothetical protein